jgi:EmrB/QacA subfamily drug resistance transporter
MAYALQQTMVIPALPTLQRELHTTTTWVTWVFTSFLLVSAVATPLLGKLGDQYGKERVLMLSLIVFLLGCVGAIVAWNIWSLIAFRAIQGLGGAVFPLSFAIVKDQLPSDKVGTGIGVLSTILAVGGGIGLALAGVIIDYSSWRLLFVAGAVPVAAAAVLVHLFVPESPIKTRTRLDIAGAILLSSGLVALLLALTEGGSWGWQAPRIVALFTFCALSLVGWCVVELRVEEPMVDMRMLADRPVLFTNLAAIASGFALLGAFVLIPNFVETPRGLPATIAGLVHYGFRATATMAGLYLLPGPFCGLLVGPLAGPMGNRYGYKWPLSLGMLLTASGITALALWHGAPWQIVVGMMALGSGAPLSYAAMGKLIVDAVRPTETGVATGMNTVMRTLGSVIGGQVGATILTASVIGRTAVPTESAYTTALWLCAGAAVIGAVFGVFVTPRRPRHPVPLLAHATE